MISPHFTHLFKASFKGPITPFITGFGAHRCKDPYQILKTFNKQKWPLKLKILVENLSPKVFFWWAWLSFFPYRNPITFWEW